MPPKSILKNAGGLPSSVSLPVPKTDAEKRRLQTAIEHAQLLEDQKQIQAKNLTAIEELSDLPEAAEPTPGEVERFTSLVTAFQPSDYDALVEERHANDRCGYTLCPHPPRKADPKRSWLRAKGSENWCSDACARKALYIKAQLDEVPAWERRGGSSPSLVLYTKTEPLPVRTKHVSGGEDLARERGEKISSMKLDNVVSSEIIEKKISSVASAPLAVPFDEFAHQSIEGYTPRAGRKADT